MSDEPVDAEWADAGGEVDVYQPQQPVNLFGAPNPVAVIERSVEVAEALTKIIHDRKLFATIQGKEHVTVEGWTLLGSMMGVFPVVTWSRPLENGWEARVEARTRDGAVVGAAEAECTRDEKEWGPNPSKGKPKDDYALRSMAQTRATSKALRGPLGFIVHLAGFQATPEAEIPAEPEPDGESGADRQRTDAQNRKLRAVLAELDKSSEVPPSDAAVTWTGYAHEVCFAWFGKHSSKDLTVGEMGRLIDHLEKLSVPFG